MTSPQKTTVAPLLVRPFLLPKEGNDLSECEDAIGVNQSAGRFAVADGATEAFDAGNWARRLAQNWVEQQGLLSRSGFWEWLIGQGQALSDAWSGQQLAWYSEEKQRIGSFAAFVGVEIDFSSSPLTWKAVALGDSCLIHVRGGNVIESFPLTHSTSFGSAPVLAPSSTAVNSQALNEISVSSGQIVFGDELFLLSDAVASWYLMLSESGDAAMRQEFSRLLSQLKDETQQPLVNFLELQRSLGRLKNDDVAILRLARLVL